MTIKWLGEKPKLRWLGAVLVDTSACETYTPILPAIVWPQDAKNYLNEVDADYKALDLDVVKSTVDPTFKQQWAAQLSAWKKFYADNIGIFYFGAASLMDQTDRYLCAVQKYRYAFIQAGGKPLSPTPVMPGTGAGSPKSGTDWTGLLQTLGFIIIGGGVLYLGGQVVGKLPAAKPRQSEKAEAAT